MRETIYGANWFVEITHGIIKLNFFIIMFDITGNPTSTMKRNKAKASERIGSEPSRRTERRKRFEKRRFQQWAEQPSSSETETDSCSDDRGQSQHPTVRNFVSFLHT